MEILAISLAAILFYFLTRGLIYDWINNNLKKRKRKGLSQNQSFKEWFFYLRYNRIVPKRLLLLYFSNIILAIILIIAFVTFEIINYQAVSRAILRLYFTSNALLIGLFSLLNRK